MDIYCATCREPWDHHHMREDEIWETWDGCDDSETHERAKAFIADPLRTLTPELREAFDERGWKFGATIFTILRCSCCDANEADNGPPDKDEVEQRKAGMLLVEEGLGDDHDGLISTLNDFEYLGLFDGKEL